jgi:hypothetical protein
MSYDVALGVRVKGRWYEIVEVGNMTSNVASMWRLASPDTDGLAGLDTMLAGEAAKHLSTAVLRMRADPDPYVALSPANGWGSYDGALEFLTQVLKACREHPWLTVSVDK